MTYFRKDDAKFEVSAGEGVQVHWERTARDRGEKMVSGIVPEPPSWVGEIEQAGFEQLDHKCILEPSADKAMMPAELTMSFQLPQKYRPDTRDDVLVIAVEEEGGKIKSIYSRVAGEMDLSSLYHDLYEYQAFFTLKGLGKRVVRFFKIAIKKIKDARKKLSAWSEELKKQLYKAIDRAFFKPDNDFGLKCFGENSTTESENLKKIHKCMQEGRSLLFIHGIFSNVSAAFGDLADGGVLQAVHEHYDNRVFGFDHPTYSRDTLENALTLIEKLPHDAELDLICHSRGALVTRCLLEHPVVIDKAHDKGINFNKVMFVAGACRGSRLASGEFRNDLFTMFTALKVIQGVGKLVGIIKVVAEFAHKAPGVSCLDPDSALIEAVETNKGCNSAGHLSFCRANYDPDKLPADISDEVIVDRFAFAGMANDMVVPYVTADISQEYSGQEPPTIFPGVDFGNNEQPVVYHLNFFSQPQVQQKILELMINNDIPQVS